MRNITPHVFITASTRVNEPGMRAWLDHIGASKFNFAPETTDAERVVMAAGKRCYMSFLVGLNPNISKVREDMRDFIDNIMRSKHGSTLAHVRYTFGIEDVSRVFTAEWNRHHAGVADGGITEEDDEWAISEGSMRYIRLTDIPYWVPASLMPDENDTSVVLDMKEASRTIFRDSFQQAEKNYQALLDLWDLDRLSWQSTETRRNAFAVKKKLTSCFRRIIPIGVATGGVWSGGLRALRNIFTQRCTPEAEEEMLLVACLMLKEMRAFDPLFFHDFEESGGYWYPQHYKV